MSKNAKRNDANPNAGPQPVVPKALTDYKDSKHNKPKPTATTGSASGGATTSAAPKQSQQPQNVAAAAASLPALGSTGTGGSTNTNGSTNGSSAAPSKGKGIAGAAQQDISHLISAVEGKAPKAVEKGVGIVRAVQSGDCIVVLLDPKSGAERTITLSGIQAPRFAKSRNQNDEV